MSLVLVSYNEVLILMTVSPTVNSTLFHPLCKVSKIKILIFSKNGHFQFGFQNPPSADVMYGWS